MDRRNDLQNRLLKIRIIVRLDMCEVLGSWPAHSLLCFLDNLRTVNYKTKESEGLIIKLDSLYV